MKRIQSSSLTPQRATKNLMAQAVFEFATSATNDTLYPVGWTAKYVERQS